MVKIKSLRDEWLKGNFEKREKINSTLDEYENKTKENKEDYKETDKEN